MYVALGKGLLMVTVRRVKMRLREGIGLAREHEIIDFATSKPVERIAWSLLSVQG